MPSKKKSEPVVNATDLYPENQLPVIGNTIVNLEVDVYHKGKISKKKISDFRGKWLIMFFYPADFTFVCPTEIEDMADQYAELKKMGCEVMSVSTDTAFVHKAWHDQSAAVGKVEFPMAADPTGMLSRSMGVYIEEEGVALRGTFIINPDGELVASEVNNNDIGRNAEETVRKVKAAQFVSKNAGLVCPAKWTPGAETLKPGVNLVGKI